MHYVLVHQSGVSTRLFKPYILVHMGPDIMLFSQLHLVLGIPAEKLNLTHNSFYLFYCYFTKNETQKIQPKPVFKRYNSLFLTMSMHQFQRKLKFKKEKKAV